MDNDYDIVNDPEANILYQRCEDVDGALWEALAAADPAEVTDRTMTRHQGDTYCLPFLNQELLIQPAKRRLWLSDQKTTREPEFQLCLTALLFLLKVDAARLSSRQVSPKEYKGGITFFQGPHIIPTTRLEARFGTDRSLFLTAGRRLGGKELAQGDAAVALTPYPNLKIEVILWLGDEEFPPQVVLTAPATLERFWALDGVWALLNVVARELWRAGKV
ncbi:DUF3786 domain-containing protein [Desulfobacca acetoxidans]|uniref:DUF3786 domain-containing protein n=1 Tax=Desulfobacca acetoxidans (strain ATCC 700848 / DSM 11109 / ASRB2) TaxID=880072 RepID=F2NHD8_DESAR|nr:DUF3786 domain-containing protein [Desulfobacca acetoxidans]AEB09054.1 hypothetical protein Desac_1192 [Desulfobacca acetoxidans DSM 11109]